MRGVAGGLGSAVAATLGAGLGVGSSGIIFPAEPGNSNAGIATAAASRKPDYRGPNLIIIRFGGGVRRRETIDPAHTFSPWFRHEFIPRGTFFPRMEIGPAAQNTGHGQGTLNILTGIYDRYADVDKRFMSERFEARVPTLFEYLRKTFDVPEHQALIVNGEDRIDEEFYTFSNHHLFGVEYRSNVLSLFRFKMYLLRRRIAEGKLDGKALIQGNSELARMESLDYRVEQSGGRSAATEAFWEKWRGYYGETGLVNPRGDQLLTELAIRAMADLRPRMMMINYNDCDYVHWGHMDHYTRGIQIMDEGLRRLVEAVEADEAYRGNTIFCVVPDCGRDTNRLRAVPCQHHFNSRSSREIFAHFFGPGVPRGGVVDRTVEQLNVAATLGVLMGVPTPHAEGSALEEAIA